jgi:hypothetical protein
MTMTNLEVIVDGVVAVLKCLNSVGEASQSNEAATSSSLSLYAQQWHTRWLSLTLSAAYGAYTTQQSPRELFSLPARAFVALVSCLLIFVFFSTSDTPPSFSFSFHIFIWDRCRLTYLSLYLYLYLYLYLSIFFYIGILVAFP